MAFKIIVSPRAQEEIEKAIDYYTLYSIRAPIFFVIRLKEAYKTLETNPFFKVCYKNVRALKLKTFPYSLFFTIHKNTDTVHVLSCFHNKLNPNKWPLYSFS